MHLPTYSQLCIEATEDESFIDNLNLEISQEMLSLPKAIHSLHKILEKHQTREQEYSTKLIPRYIQW